MTISFNGLGNEGRLGNQIFQYAFMKGISSKCNLEFMIPDSEADRYDNYGLFDCFELSGCKTGEVNYPTIECRDTLFNEELFNSCKDNVNYSGTYQTEKYFENVDSELRKDLTFKKGYIEPCQEFIDSLGGRDKCIFLHVRRGNPNITGRRGEKWSYQMLQDSHPLCKKEYYLEALKEFPDDKNVIIVSDLIGWCKKQDWLQEDRFYFSDSSYEVFGDGASIPYVDLCLMSLCGGGIIANSSLSWWGAWLQNNTGKIVAPDPWYGNTYSHLDTKDLIPDRWVKLYNDPTPIPPEE
tara:strand:- start:3929 stop:4813 length:885 start_codon:yes stop_codon:yes gene_type:complete